MRLPSVYACRMPRLPRGREEEYFCGCRRPLQSQREKGWYGNVLGPEVTENDAPVQVKNQIDKVMACTGWV
jgi:hypothetical protein